MDRSIIAAMVSALRPVLKDTREAMDILERFWSARIAIVWTVEDIHTAANERELALTHKEASVILHHLFTTHNKQHGLKWEDITEHLEEQALGRKLTRAELNRFIKQNKLIIHKPKRSKRESIERKA